MKIETFQIQTKKGVIHTVYEKEIKGSVCYVAMNHFTKFNPKKVTKL